jgi:hypothetical protein
MALSTILHQSTASVCGGQRDVGVLVALLRFVRGCASASYRRDHTWCEEPRSNWAFRRGELCCPLHCRVHEAHRTTPAVVLEITDHVWSIGELLDAALAIAAR